MIRKVFWVGLFTGLSHGISLGTVIYVTRFIGEETTGLLGVVDSYYAIIASIISFGVQLAVNRNVATTKGWRSNYQIAQASRLSLGLIILIYGILTLIFNWDPTKIIYLFAPLVALNGDYALYGDGKPVHASSLSFLRVALPNLGLLITVRYLGAEAIYLYIMILGLGLFIIGIIAARWNKVRYIHKPRAHFYKFYYKYLKVGVYQVASVLLVTGVIAVSKGFYSLGTIGLVWGILKIYEVYKGGLRIIVQTFFKELNRAGSNLKIDKASLLIWGFVAIPLIIFDQTALHIVYENEYDSYAGIFPLLGILMFFASFRNGSDGRILMLRKDDINLYAFISGLIIELAVIIAFSDTIYNFWGIPFGLLAGEIVIMFIQGYGLGLGKFLGARIMFLARQLPPLIPAVLIKVYYGDRLEGLIASCSIYVIWVVYFNKRLIFDQQIMKKSDES